MNINYKINKNEIIKNFNDFFDKNTDKEDFYNSKGKEVQYRNDYYILDKIKAIYLYIINNIKLDIRKEFIHDDDAYKKVINLLIDRVNNKIRSNSNGGIHVSVGYKDKIDFDGSDEKYKEYVILRKQKRTQLIGKIVDELNAVLDNSKNKESGKPVLNANNFIIKEININKEEFIHKILENNDICLQIIENDFIQFDKVYFNLVNHYNINIDQAKEILENIHDKFLNSNKPSELYNKFLKEADDAPKQIYKRFSDPGLENRREKSMDVLKGRGLTARGGGWHNKRGELVATIGDKGEIVWKNNTLSQPTAGGTSQGISSAGKSIEQGFAQQQPAMEPEVETGLSDKELEYIRKMNEDMVSI